MAVVKVPKTPKRAFDKGRRPSALLRGQIAHLVWAALPASQRNPGSLPEIDVRTEGQAAERIAELTTIVLQQSVAPADTPAPQLAPGLPAKRTATRTVKRTSRRAKRTRTRKKK